jgi:hypothetical protein
MVVYRNCKQTIKTYQQIAFIEKLVDSAIPTRSDFYDIAISLMIECGELETGITDYFCNEKDFINKQIEVCRSISMEAGAVIFSLWSEGMFQIDRWLNIKNSLSILKQMQIPEEITVNVPEGFVFYGLYPEVYFEAASRFIKEMKPEKAIVIGLRSIGTVLSALIGAHLQSVGCMVKTLTVRPRGHPFNRFLILDEKIKYMIRISTGYYVLIADEGPGLSGSSIGGTLSMVKDLNVPSSRTVIFPSWLPLGDRFISENARVLWNDYKKYIGCFKNQWIINGRLERNLKKKLVYEISAGMWRSRFIQETSDYPPVHPHHERRKYLLVDNSEEKKNIWIAKFVGLGKYGASNVTRAHKLAEMWFTPSIDQLSNGFAVMRFVEGKALKASDLDESLIDFVKKYLLFIQKTMGASLQVSYDQMLEMIYTNVKEGLGESWCRCLEKFTPETSALYEESAVAIDGHMMPHDFLKTGGRFVKVDHIEHHSDQFFHGVQNICWDIAGFCIEFELDRRKREHFLESFTSIDSFVYKRQQFFNIAYLAFRLGYVSLAADSLKGETDAERFEKLRKKYCIMLKNELKEL